MASEFEVAEHHESEDAQSAVDEHGQLTGEVGHYDDGAHEELFPPSAS